MAGVGDDDGTSGPGSVHGARRGAAALALLSILVALVAGVYLLIGNLGRIVIADLAAVIGITATFTAVIHRGARRMLAAFLAVTAAVVVVTVFVGSGMLVGIVVVVLAGITAGYGARFALGVSPSATTSARPAAPVARQAVLFMNPRSGGGKVDRFRLVDRARALGAEVVVVTPPFDLEAAARQAVAGGADLLGVAGGDGSIAPVARVAAESGVAFVCVPAGTRNHFALDLGLDRTDPAHALTALTDGVDHMIDVGVAGDRVFVNNVSLGVYAQVVQSPDYRAAKVGTFAAQLPDLLGPDSGPFDLQVTGPDGVIDGPQLVVVSNNPYRFDGLTAFGHRDRLDSGVLGVVVTTVTGPAEVTELVRLAALGSPDRFRGWHQWVAPTVEIHSRSGRIDAGVDGEAVVVDSPMQISSWPAAVRVRLPRQRRSPPPPRVRFNRATVVRLAYLAVRGRDGR